MKSFGIFEGGGAKGLAHIGALKVAEKRHVEFIGLAGSSAGALVAALISAGYRADRIYNPDRPEGCILNEDIVSLLDSKLWRKLCPIKDLLKREGSSLRASKWSLLWHCSNPKKLPLNFDILSLVYRIFRYQGIFDAGRMREWIEGKLQDLIDPIEGRPIAFAQMPIPLSIVATNLASRSLQVFNNDNSLDSSVAEAVTASMNLPFVFKPFLIGNQALIDGGVLSNFPAWVFDEQRKAAREPIPTFGFKLNKTSLRVPNCDSTPFERGIINFFDSFFATVFSGDNILEVREIEDLNLIPIDVRASTLDFDMTLEEKRVVYNEGRIAATEFFTNYIGPKDPDPVRSVLGIFKNALRHELGGDLHLRANVWLPVLPKSDKLRILYKHNMSKDADDRMILGENEGCVGLVWQQHKVVCADLADAQVSYNKSWNMTKYQQALVRPSLKSLIGVPIFDWDRFDMKAPWIDNPVVGVFCIDSDENLLAAFSAAAADEGDRVRALLIEATKVLWMTIFK